MKEILDRLKKDRIKTYMILTIKLDAAQADNIFPFVGSYIYVLDATTGHDVQIKFNEISNDLTPLQKFRAISTPFYRFFLTSSAMAGGSIKLGIGIETAEFDIQDFGATLIESVWGASSAGTIFLVTNTVASTEYSQALPAGTKKFLIKCKDGDLSVGFVTAGNKIYLAANQPYYEDGVNLTGVTLYFSSTVAGSHTEIIAWV